MWRILVELLPEQVELWSDSGDLGSISRLAASLSCGAQGKVQHAPASNGGTRLIVWMGVWNVVLYKIYSSVLWKFVL
jgi:hypothetical protein